MQEINIILVGYGNVGQAFVNLLNEKSPYCQKKYGLDIRLRALFDIKFSSRFNEEGSFVFPKAVTIDEILNENADAIERVRSLYWQKEKTFLNVLQTIEPGVLVECILSKNRSGKSGFKYIQQAIINKWNVVTADKEPLVHSFSELLALTKKNCVQLKLSGATAAALPTLDVALLSLAGTEIQYFEGILNGTSNYILSEMTKGMSYKSALKKAQSKGIAETNPSLDVDGWDTAYKILLLANTVFQENFTLEDIDIQGIADIDEKIINKAVKQGEKIKLLGKLWREDKIRMKVAPELIGVSHPLYGVDGTNKGITFSTDTMSDVTVTGGKSDPKGAAAALLKDIINIYRLDYS
jgi:homoserine dehydrogenase